MVEKARPVPFSSERGLMLELRAWITRAEVQRERDKLFVFGDNVIREGFGGQARVMRGEPNAVGIITKHRPTMEKHAFLSDDFFEAWIKLSGPDFLRLFLHKGTIVWPGAGIGTGLAQLPSRAPLIFEAVELLKEKL